MSSLVPRLGDTLELFGTDRPLGRVPRDVAKAVRAEHAAAVVRGARVTGRAFVTHLSVTHTAQLSRDEEGYIQMAPTGEARYKHLIDTFAMFCGGEVGRP